MFSPLLQKLHMASSPSPERLCTTELGHLLDAFYVPTPLQPVVTSTTVGPVWTSQLLSPGECRRLVAATEQLGYGRTDYDQAYRGNLRLQCDDASLARALKPRVLGLLPLDFVLPWRASGESRSREGCDLDPPADATLRALHDAAEGATVWSMAPCGLNPRVRFSKYEPGARFARHVDSWYEDSSGDISMLTVNIYLNDDASLTDPALPAAATRLHTPPAGHVDIVPRAGLALIFQQAPMADLVHEGLAVQRGHKYLMRLDAMFRRVQ